MSASASAARLISSGKQITSRGLAPPSAHQVPNSNFQLPNSKFDSLQEQQLPTTCAIHCAPFERAQLTTQIERALKSSNDGTSKFQLPNSSPRSRVGGAQIPFRPANSKFVIPAALCSRFHLPHPIPRSSSRFVIPESKSLAGRLKEKNSPNSKFVVPNSHEHSR